MIDLCDAFSLGKGKNKECLVFRSLFNIKSEKLQDLHTALATLRKAAVGHQTSNESKELGVRDLRNKMFHDFLTLSTRDFENLVECSKQVLSSIHTAISCLCGEHRSDYVQQAFAEIDDIVIRDLTVAKLSDDERDELNRRNQQMLEEHENLMREEAKVMKQKLGRKFDSFAVCLKNDLLEHLIPSVYCTYIFNTII